MVMLYTFCQKMWFVFDANVYTEYNILLIKIDGRRCCMCKWVLDIGIGIIKICPHTNNKTAHYGEIIIDRDKFRILYFLIVQNKTDFSYRLIISVN